MAIATSETMSSALKALGRILIAGLHSDMVSKNLITVGQSVTNEFAELGSTVTFRKSPTYTTQRFTSGDSINKNTYAPSSVPITLNTILKCPIEISAFTSSAWGNRDLNNPVVVIDALRQSGIDVQQMVKSLVKEADEMTIENLRLSQYYSTLTATPVLSDLTGMKAVCRRRGMSPNDINAMLDCETAAEIFNISEMHKANELGNTQVMADGIITRALGINWYESNNCRANTTPGDAALAVNNKGTPYAAGDTSIAFDTGSGSDLAAGDMVKFGNGTTYYTVQSVTFGVAGVSGTMVINALDATNAALAADDAAITVIKPNDAFVTNKSSIVFGNRPLPKYLNPNEFELRIDSDFGSGRFVFSTDTETNKETLIYEMLVGVAVTEEKFIQKMLNIS